MLDFIKALSQTSLTGILAVAGVLFIFLSIGGKLGPQIITDKIQKRYASIIGIILLLCSLAMFVVSTTMRPREHSKAQVEIIKNPIIDSTKTYKLRPTLPMNQPISQVTEFEWTFSSTDKSTKCSIVCHREYVIIILGRDIDGKPSVAKRKTVLDLSTISCNIAGEREPQVNEIHGELEGTELLANQTAEGLWIWDELPGATEKQKKAMKLEGFSEPFFGLNLAIPLIVLPFLPITIASWLVHLDKLNCCSGAH